jgi:hypothetical protein
MMTNGNQSEFKGVPLSLKIIALSNIFLALYLITIVLPFFILWVVLGFVDYLSFYGFWDWFLDQVVTRFVITAAFFSCFLLFLSGVDILNRNIRVIKLMSISAPMIILSILWYLIFYPSISYYIYPKHGLNLKGVFGESLFIIALAILVVYFLWLFLCVLRKNEIIKFFKRSSTLVFLKGVSIAFLLIYLLGFWLGKIFFN